MGRKRSRTYLKVKLFLFSFDLRDSGGARI